MFLYVIQRALGITPLIFKFGESSKGDVAREFNKRHSGYANKVTPGTIRWEVARPLLLTKGFATMTGFASAFDPFHFFKDQTEEFNLGVFNGIHLPNGAGEALSNWETIFLD